MTINIEQILEQDSEKINAIGIQDFLKKAHNEFRERRVSLMTGVEKESDATQKMVRQLNYASEKAEDVPMFLGYCVSIIGFRTGSEKNKETENLARKKLTYLGGVRAFLNQLEPKVFSKFGPASEEYKSTVYLQRRISEEQNKINAMLGGKVGEADNDTQLKNTNSRNLTDANDVMRLFEYLSEQKSVKFEDALSVLETASNSPEKIIYFGHPELDFEIECMYGVKAVDATIAYAEVEMNHKNGVPLFEKYQMLLNLRKNIQIITNNSRNKEELIQQSKHLEELDARIGNSIQELIRNADNETYYKIMYGAKG